MHSSHSAIFPMPITSRSDHYTILSACGAPGSLHVYSPRDNAPRHIHNNCHVRSPSAAAVTPSSLYVLSQAPKASAAQLCTHVLATSFSATATANVTRKMSPGEPLTVLAVSTSKALLAAGAKSGRVSIWHLASGILLGTFWPHIHSVTAVSFTDDDDALITAASDASILIHRLADILNVQRSPTDSIDPLIRLSGHTLPVTDLSVGFAGISARIVSVADDRTLRVWHLASAMCLATLLLEASPSKLAFSSDETSVAISLRNGSVVLIDVTSLDFGTTRAARKDEIIPRPATASGEQLQATAIAFAPSGIHVVVGYSDGVVRLYDTFSFALVHAYTKHATTASVTFVGTVSALQPLDPEQTPSALARSHTRTGDADRTTAPLVTFQHAPPLSAAVWEFIRNIADDAFSSERIARMDDVDCPLQAGDTMDAEQEHDRKHQGSSSKKDVVLEEVLREVYFLRRRNLQLEEAGRKLLNLVQKHAT